jgi:hypothetical protein
VTPSPNDTVVKAGSTAAITDASGNKWTITSGAQVAVNGTADPTTANVIELAYVNGTIWQENTSKLWWGETKPDGSWATEQGTATSPLPTAITIGATQASATVSLSQVSVAATSGNHMVFISGSGDSVNLTGGTDTITDTGHGNAYVIPVAGKGYDTFTSDILKIGDTLNFTAALAKTNWNGSAPALPNYIHLSGSTNGLVISLSSTANGSSVAVSTIQQGGSETLTSLLAHSTT